MEGLLSQLKEMLTAFHNDDELFEIAAKTLKKSYDALIKAGFTPEQATLIVAHQGGPKLNS